MREKFNLEKVLELLGRACDLDHPELESMPVWNHALKDKSSFKLTEGKCYSEEFILGKEYIPVVGDIKDYFDNRSRVENTDTITEPELKDPQQTATIHAVVGVEYQKPSAKGDPDVKAVYQRFILQEKIAPVHISNSELSAFLKTV